MGDYPVLRDHVASQGTISNRPIHPLSATQVRRGSGSFVASSGGIVIVESQRGLKAAAGRGKLDRLDPGTGACQQQAALQDDSI
jgi:hypothetical protein